MTSNNNSNNIRHLPSTAPGHTKHDRGPTAAELAAIENEMPVIDAEVELLDVQISLLDSPRTDWADRRLRRAHRRVLTARTAVARQVIAVLSVGGEAA